MCGSARSQVLQRAWGPDRKDGESTIAPGSLDLHRGSSSARQRRERAGPTSALRLARSRTSALLGPVPLGLVGPGSGCRLPRAASGQSSVRSLGTGRVRAGGLRDPDSREFRGRPPPAHPGPRVPWPPHLGRQRLGGSVLRSRAARQPPASNPRERPKSSQAPRPSPRRAARRSGDYFPPPARAPPLVLARRNAPRCAAGGRIQRILRDL